MSLWPAEQIDSLFYRPTWRPTVQTPAAPEAPRRGRYHCCGAGQDVDAKIKNNSNVSLKSTLK